MRAVLSRWFTVKKKHVLYFLASFAILALVLYQADLGKVAGVLSKARLELVFLGFVLTVANLFCKVVRWKTFTDAHKIKLSWFDNASTYLASLFIANVTPARVGEATRPLLMKKYLPNTSFFKILPAVIVERFLDVTLVLLGSLLFFFSFSFYVNDVLRYAMLAAAAILAGIFLVLANERIARAFITLVFKIFGFLSLAGKWKPKLEGLLENFYHGVRVLDKKTLLKAFLWTAGSWFCEFLIMYYAVLALGFDFNVALAVGTVSLAMVGAVLSGLPGGLGSAEAIIYSMFLVFGFDSVAALSITLLSRFMAYGYTLIACFPFLLRETRKL